jgi:hypothetical protein
MSVVLTSVYLKQSSWEEMYIEEKKDWDNGEEPVKRSIAGRNG